MRCFNNRSGFAEIPALMVNRFLGNWLKFQKLDYDDPVMKKLLILFQYEFGLCQRLRQGDDAKYRTFCKLYTDGIFNRRNTYYLAK